MYFGKSKWEWDGFFLTVGGVLLLRAQNYAPGIRSTTIFIAIRPYE